MKSMLRLVALSVCVFAAPLVSGCGLMGLSPSSEEAQLSGCGGSDGSGASGGADTSQGGGGGSGGGASVCAQKGTLAPGQEIVDAMDAKVSAPEDLDPVTEELGIPPSLVNPALAISVDLSAVGVCGAVFLPVQVSGDVGGRTSAFMLKMGERTLTGYYVADGLVWRQFLERLSGDSLPASPGDEYALRIETLEGEARVVANGTLTAFKGVEGSFSFKGEAVTPAGIGPKVTIYYECRWASIFKKLLITQE